MKRGRQAATTAPESSNSSEPAAAESGEVGAAGNWKDLKYKTSSSSNNITNNGSGSSVTRGSARTSAKPTAAAATAESTETSDLIAKKRRTKEKEVPSVEVVAAAAALPAVEEVDVASSSKKAATAAEKKPATAAAAAAAAVAARSKNLPERLVDIVSLANPSAATDDDDVITAALSAAAAAAKSRSGRAKKNPTAAEAAAVDTTEAAAMATKAGGKGARSRRSSAAASPNARSFYWSKERLQRLREAVGQLSSDNSSSNSNCAIDWTVVAEAVGDGANWHQCLTRWKFEVGHNGDLATAAAFALRDLTATATTSATTTVPAATTAAADNAVDINVVVKKQEEDSDWFNWTEKLDKRLLRLLRHAAKKMETDPPLSVQQCVDRFLSLQQEQHQKKSVEFIELPPDIELLTSEQRRKSVARTAARNRIIAANVAAAARSNNNSSSGGNSGSDSNSAAVVRGSALSAAEAGSSSSNSSVDAVAAELPALFTVQGGYCTRPYNWSDELQDRLMEGFQQYGKDWEMVAEFVGENKSAKQCSSRWNYLAEVRLGNCKVGPWSIEEKHELVNYLESNPEGRRVLQQSRDGNFDDDNTATAASAAGGGSVHRKHRFERKFWVPLAGKLNRTVRDCSTTFRNFLDSQRKCAMKKGPLTYEELSHLKSQVQQWTARGEKQGFWQQMEKELNRPAGNLERRWHKRLMYQHKRSRILDIGDLSELAAAHCAGSNEKIEQFNREAAAAKEAREVRIAEQQEISSSTSSSSSSSSAAAETATAAARKKKSAPAVATTATTKIPAVVPPPVAAKAKAATKTKAKAATTAADDGAAAAESDATAASAAAAAAENNNLISAAIGGLFGLISDKSNKKK